MGIFLAGKRQEPEVRINRGVFLLLLCAENAVKNREEARSVAATGKQQGFEPEAER
jgi:hypothetical protein